MTGMAEKHQPECDPRTVQRLVHELQSGNDTEESARKLFHCYYKPVAYFFRKRGVSSEGCRDLTQETFLKAFESLGSFQHDSSFDTWLYTIAGNVWKNRLRGGATQKRSGHEIPIDTETGYEIEDPSVSDPEAEVLEAERVRTRRHALRQALQELPPQMRRVFLLRYERGLKYREIAELLNIDINTVKSSLHTARKRLTATVGEGFPELGL